MVISRNLFRLRNLCFLLSVGLGVAALFPEIALIPLEEASFSMRSPATALRFAPWLLAAAAAAFAVAFLGWHRLSERVLRLVRRVIELAPAPFWVTVFVCALVPRLLLAATVAYKPSSDAWWLHEAAFSLAKGDGFAVGGQLTAFRPPGYPFLLSLTYRLFESDNRLAWFWGIVSTAIIVLAIHFIAKRLYGTAVARLAALFAATYPALILMTVSR